MQVPDLDERSADFRGGTGGVGMASIAATYGLGAGAAESAFFPQCILMLVRSCSRRRRAVRLLVLGDSLAAGYGLPHDDGLRGPAPGGARGARARRARSSTARSRATPPPAAARGSTGRWPTAPTPRSSSSAPMTACAASTRRRWRPTSPPFSTRLPPGTFPCCLPGCMRRPISAPNTAALPRRVRPAGQRPGHSLRSVLPRGHRHATGAQPAGRPASQRRGREAHRRPPAAAGREAAGGGARRQ